ncbi:MAG: sulfurtransferase TusA family protein [Acinetobacter sp.]
MNASNTLANCERIVVDAMGKPCPMPLLMLKRAYKSEPDRKFQLLASDPNSEIDILRYCQIQNLHCEMLKLSDCEIHYFIESHE